MAKRKRIKKGKALARLESKQNIERAAGMSGPMFMNLSSHFVSPRRGTRELLELFSQSPWLRAIVGKIARSVAEIDWVLAAKQGSDGKFVSTNVPYSRSLEFPELVKKDIDEDRLTRIENHPIYDLFNRGTGNPRLSGFSVFQITQCHIDLTGEAFWIIEKNNFGIPEAIWPIPPAWVRSLPTKDRPFYEIHMPRGVSVEVPLTEIVPFVDPNPLNPYDRGTGVANSLDDEIQIDEYAAKHQKSFFLNRARPDIIISGQHISKPDAERLETKWLSDHQGFWKAFKPLFFSQKIDVKELTQTFESMQMTQIRKHERDTFISVFGAPPEKFGVIGESKRSTIAAADFFWNKDIIKPRVEALRRSIQSVLIPMFDERLILTYETPVIQDEEFKLKVMEKSSWSLTVNEWRKQSGAPSLGPAGDVLMVPLNMQVLPVKDQDGNPVDQDDMLEHNRKNVSLADAELVNTIEKYPSNLAGEISKEISDLLSGSLDEIKSSIKSSRGSMDELKSTIRSNRGNVDMGRG